MSQQIRTFQEIVQRAFYMTRLYTPNNKPNNNQLQEGIEYLNIMLDDFSKDQLFVPVNSFLEFSLTGNKATYSFSNTVTADFDVPMIVDLQSCVLVVNNIQQPVQMVTPEQVAGIFLVKNIQQQPGCVVLEKYTEYSTLTFYSTPDQNYTCQIRYKAALNSVALNDNLTNVPNYYHMYLIYELASFFCDFYSNAKWDEKKQKKLEEIGRAHV